MGPEPPGKCVHAECTVSTDGKCLEGHSRLNDCPHYSLGTSPSVKPGATEQDAEGKTNGKLGPSPGLVNLADGEDLDPQSASRVTREALTRVIILAGPADSGKTTLLISVYDRFQRGEFAGYIFAGSQTLLGFERRCHFGRIASGRATPETPRTPQSLGHRFLHLRVRPADLACGAQDLLFSDMAGEWFRLARDSTEECKRLALLMRADHFVVLVDGAKLVEPEQRHAVANDASLLLRSCLDAGMLGVQSLVDVLFTKWDLVVTSGSTDEIERFTAGLRQRLQDRFAGRLQRLRLFEVAARPVPESRLEFAYGLPRVFPAWVEESPISRSAKPGVPVVPGAMSEFARYLRRRLPGYGA